MTEKEFIVDLENITKKIAKEIPNILIASAKFMEGELKLNIFNKGKGTDGKKITIKGYSNSYKRKRIKSGRQIKFVDSEFTGDLRRSIQVVADNKDVVIAIVTEESVKKQVRMEKLYKKEIYKPSDVLIKDTNLYTDDLIKIKIDNAL